MIAMWLAAAAAPATADQLVLWQLAGASNTVHLFGSVHFADDQMYPLDATVEEAFAGAEHLVLEIDLRASAAEVQQLTIAHGLFTDGRTLAQVLPQELYARARVVVEALGLPMRAVEPMRPWLLALTVSTLRLGEAGFSAQQGLDLHFLERAGERAVHGLETAAYQIERFSGMAPELELRFLQATLEELATDDTAIDDLFDVWRRGDVAALAAMLHASFADPELRPIHERLFTERNRAMAAQIAEYLRADQDYFVVVGAGHLVGAQSILELLTERNIAITRLCADVGTAPAAATPR